jgi:hypothetical protein
MAVVPQTPDQPGAPDARDEDDLPVPQWIATTAPDEPDDDPQAEPLDADAPATRRALRLRRTADDDGCWRRCSARAASRWTPPGRPGSAAGCGRWR